MPGEGFYSGLTLGEQVRKFLDHHYDPRTRHISAYEAQMLDRARARVEQTLAVATQEATREMRSVYEALLQLYETRVMGESRAVAVRSFPAWHLSDPSGLLAAAGLTELVRDPTPSQVQAVLAALMSSRESDEPLPIRYSTFNTNRLLIERELDQEALMLVNRLLYEPTVVAENSWADVAPLLDHLGKAKTKGAPVIVFGGALAAKGNLIVAFLAGGSVIALQLLASISEGMTPGFKALGEKLTAGWRADNQVTVEDDESS
jgi:hypothetical protein